MILDPLGLYRWLHEVTQPLVLHRWPFDAQAVPANGVYLVYEEGELFEGAPRIVRVGSHPTQGRLRGRLRDHWGSNKEGSIFRKHLGSALMTKRTYPEEQIALWIRSRTHGWSEIEHAITSELEQRFTFSCIRIDDAVARMDMERRLIASLSCLGESPASEQWLGRLARRPIIPACGMWNSRHVGDPDVLDEYGLRQLAGLVTESLHRTPVV